MLEAVGAYWDSASVISKHKTKVDRLKNFFCRIVITTFIGDYIDIRFASMHQIRLVEYNFSYN